MKDKTSAIWQFHCWDRGWLRRRKFILYRTQQDHRMQMMLFLLSIGFFFGLMCLFILSIVGALRNRYHAIKAIESANYNAALWAEAERRRYDAEIENARLRGSLDTSQSCYAQMSQIARHAIKAGEIAADVPEKLRMIDDDSVLNAEVLTDE